MNKYQEKIRLNIFLKIAKNIGLLYRTAFLLEKNFLFKLYYLHIHLFKLYKFIVGQYMQYELLTIEHALTLPTSSLQISKNIKYLYKLNTLRVAVIM